MQPVRHCVAVVDDDILVLDLVSDDLEDLGYRVERFADPRDALRWIRAGGAPDLLITDIRMPGMNGLALAEQARAARPGLNVLFMSGYAGEYRILDLGRLPLLQKPFLRHVLQRSVESAMQPER